MTQNRPITRVTALLIACALAVAAGACGDWCIAPRVEAAFESGHAMAHSVLSMLGKLVPRSAAEPQP